MTEPTKPLPPSGLTPPPSSRRGRPPKYPWAQLELHGHFVVPFDGKLKPDTPGSLVDQQNRRERQLGSTRRYRIEWVSGADGWRVWRVA